MEQTRWAIVGTGYIANEFASGMREVKDAELAAVVSRNEEKGKAFAQKYHCEKVYTDLKTMLKTENIDVVYIAIPNDCHYSYIMTALNDGVPVLCEKPMVDNRKQFDEVVSKAREKQVFLMEGMWTRCFPAVRKAAEWIREGKIGEPLSVRSGFDIKPDAGDWQPWKGGIRHAGGALRDVGIYALAMAYMVFPHGPETVYSVMKSNGEVDESFHMMMAYEDGKTAFLSGAFNQISDHWTEIIGDKGRIVIGPEFWHPKTAVLTWNDGTEETFQKDYPASGFQYEIQTVQECLKKEQKECPYFTLDESGKISDMIEKTRKEWGIIYQSDEEV
ncbi:MAG: Gfo/Idh/MocA family oxidoreductase [Dorea sp.]|jgi:dihydrodiol dehydrogenase / D-xylose 1-dehydrogenase (NADP)|nr:Gfo/Idh/MocA family oxidoreductase [Dorea sp.]